MLISAYGYIYQSDSRLRNLRELKCACTLDFLLYGCEQAYNKY